MSQVQTKFIADDAVTSAKIPANAIGNSELSSTALTGQTAETTPDNADLVLIYDDSAAGLKKMTRANFLSGLSTADFEVETFTLAGGDITNGYIDTAFACVAGSLDFKVKGAMSLLEGASHDFTVAPTGGSGGVARVTWLNDLATGGPAALIAGDIVQVRYHKA